MTDERSGSGPLRRRILGAVASSGVAVGLSGCLGFLDSDDGGPESSDGNGETDEEVTPTSSPSPPPSQPPSEEPESQPLPEVTSVEFVASGPPVALETVATGLVIPTDVAVASEERDRLFVTDQFGSVYAFEPEGEDPVDLGEREPFLDLADRVISPGSDGTNPEAGLLGLAFPPDFADNGRLFVRYSAPPDEGTPDEFHHVEVLAEFRASGDRSTVDPDSERILLEIPQPEAHHNSGDVLFGPDGYCYLTTGDSGVFTHPSTDGARSNSQNTTTNLLGGVLRIDVDSESEDRSYGIPDDNPLVDREGHRDEYYAWGFRNPWGASFDGDDLYVANVGRNLFETVFRVEKGGNYGWPTQEGTHCIRLETPSQPPRDCLDGTPDHVRGGEPFVDPVVEYSQEYKTGSEGDGEGTTESLGMAVTGGYVYRGEELPALQGKYVFADLVGRLFVASPPTEGEEYHSYYRERDLWPIRQLEDRFVDEDPDGPRTGDPDSRGLDPGETNVPVIGRGSKGELYVLTTQILDARDGETPGEVYRIVPDE